MSKYRHFAITAELNQLPPNRAVIFHSAAMQLFETGIRVSIDADQDTNFRNANDCGYL